MDEFKSSRLHSIEYNRVSWGWDIFKTHFGLRYLYFDDEYTLNSTSGAGTGVFDLDAQNHIFGPQIGTEVFYDVGYRTSWSGFVRGGVTVNIGTLDTFVTNNATTLVDQSDSEVNIGGLIEAGFTGHYQLSQRARVRFGYSGLWFSDAISTESNFPGVLANTTGQIFDEETDVFVQALNLGLEFYR